MFLVNKSIIRENYYIWPNDFQNFKEESLIELTGHEFES